MPEGLQVRSTSNILQIDGDYRNLFFKRAGRNTTSSGRPTATFPGVTPVVFMRPLLANRGIFVVEFTPVSGGNWRLVTEWPVEYYVFDLPDAQTFGLNVYNEAGQLVFNAVERPLDVIAAVQVPNQNGYTYSGLPTGKYAYSVSYSRPGAWASQYDPVSGSWDNTDLREKLFSTNNGFFTQFLDVSTWWGSPMYDQDFYDFSGPPPIVTIIDVAGIPT
jgi:hypothetical protein